MPDFKKLEAEIEEIYRLFDIFKSYAQDAIDTLYKGVHESERAIKNLEKKVGDLEKKQKR